MTDGTRDPLVARPLTRGVGTGALVRLCEPVSFWGGVDHAGTVIDRHHPDLGTSLTGRVVAMTSGRGSSSASSVLAELIRSGHAPAAIVLELADPILALGALVADELYGVTLPIVRVQTLADLPAGGVATVTVRSDPTGGSASISW